ncbi:MAG TPA: hypothetical protein DCM38_02930 [Gammaproteobacteria bacterium]|nr:hypothetical protein [Gammaproteobacteria bacterium]
MTLSVISYQLSVISIFDRAVCIYQNKLPCRVDKTKRLSQNNLIIYQFVKKVSDLIDVKIIKELKFNQRKSAFHAEVSRSET